MQLFRLGHLQIKPSDVEKHTGRRAIRINILVGSMIPVNPHSPQDLSLLALARSLWGNRRLILQMTRREVVGRYRGSAMGLAWSFFSPVFMLFVYTFVFSEIF